MDNTAVIANGQLHLGVVGKEKVKQHRSLQLEVLEWNTQTPMYLHVHIN